MLMINFMINIHFKISVQLCKSASVTLMELECKDNTAVTTLD